MGRLNVLIRRNKNWRGEVFHFSRVKWKKLVVNCWLLMLFATLTYTLHAYTRTRTLYTHTRTWTLSKFQTQGQHWTEKKFSELFKSDSRNEGSGVGGGGDGKCLKSGVHKFVCLFPFQSFSSFLFDLNDLKQSFLFPGGKKSDSDSIFFWQKPLIGILILNWQRFIRFKKIESGKVRREYLNYGSSSETPKVRLISVLKKRSDNRVWLQLKIWLKAKLGNSSQESQLR